MYFITMTLLGIAGMELMSILVHRWLFHGFLWSIHRSHHTSRKGVFEHNDIFTLIFGVIAAALIIFSAPDKLSSAAFAIGLGMTIYGLFYFVLHDLFIHRRFLPFGSRNRILLAVRAAHQRHHQKSTKDGVGPFGLFIFDYRDRSESKK
jgi:beta-carotene 3-hydroxylase